MSKKTDNITLIIPEEKYKFVLKTVNEQRDFMHKLGMNPLVKQEILRGLRIINNILTTTKKEAV